MENWSIEKETNGCKVLLGPSLSDGSIRDQAVLLVAHHSSTPLLHKPLNFQETISPLGITKPGSSGPGFGPLQSKGGLNHTIPAKNLKRLVQKRKKAGH